MVGNRIGPYRVLGDLGSGGMGKVCLAEVEGDAPGLEIGTHVALKVIHPHLLETAGFFERFLREAQIGKSIAQDNVVRCFDCASVGIDGQEQNFMVMEYVEGQTLRALLDELGSVPEELCRHIGTEIAKGLEAIHAVSVIHRDLKPENVLITKDHVVKIMDLGVAHFQDVIRLTQAGVFVGSLAYASPEQFHTGGQDVDERTDLHALGVLLYELSTGQHPYQTDDVHTTFRNVVDGDMRRAGEVNPQLSPFFEEVIHTLVAKRPDDRFSSASVLLEVLAQSEKSAWWQEQAKAIRDRTDRPLRRMRIPRETALYGRDDDLKRLHAAYEKAKGGDGQVVLIEGEAGIGKSRFVDEFVGRLQQEGEDLNFLFGSYPPGGAATEAGAFSTAYRKQFGDEGLEETLVDYLQVTPGLAPAFAALLRGETTRRGAEPLTKNSLQAAFVHTTRALAEERPTIVLIDDLHFAPEDGRALFASLALAVPEDRVLLVGTMRPGLPADWIANIERQDNASKQTLSRLGPKDLAALLKAAFHSTRLAQELGVLIGEKSDGNPFFAFEIIRGLREGKFITQNPDGAWATTQVIKEIEVPSTVLDLVQARIADLGEEDRELLDLACCCEFQFDPGLVAHALGGPMVPTLRRLARLESKHRLVRSSGRRFVFDHHQVQEALYGALPEQLREAYHVAIADALESTHGAAGKEPQDVDGGVCVDLCDHFLKGAQGKKALRYLDAALTHLETAFLNAQAIELMDRALSVPALLAGVVRLKVLIRKDGRLDLLGHRAAQEATLAEAKALADASGEKALAAQVEGARGDLFYRLGRYDEARGCFESSLKLYRACGDRPGEGRATGRLGTVVHAQGRYEQARVHYEHALTITREVGDRQGEALGISNLGNVSYALGRYIQAREYYEKSLSLCRRIGYRQGEANATGMLGNVSYSLGRYEEAGAHFEHWHRIAREIGDRQGEGMATGNLGNVFKALGRFEEAREQHEQSRTIDREVGNRRSEGLATGNLGNVLFCLGQYDEALKCHEQHLGIAREIGDRQGEARATGNLGNIAHALGRYAEAREYDERYLVLSREIGYRQGEANATANLGSVFSAFGRFKQARERYEQHLTLARELGDRRGEASTLGGLAAVERAEGNEEAALSLLEHSLSLYRRIDKPAGSAGTLLSLGDLHEAEGRLAEAKRSFESALSLGLELNDAGTVVLARCHLAVLPGGDPSEAQRAFEAQEGSLGHSGKMECHYLLWRAGDDGEHLKGAAGLLEHLVDHAPEAYRASMQENVLLHREIVEACGVRGGAG